MADLTFADSHNMVAYLEKSKDNVDFAEIVDFLNASPIRYALTVSPTVYVSYIEQFWSTAKIKTVNNETQIRAKVDGKTIVITESSVRRDLHFNDEDVFNDEYDTPSHTKKVFANMRRQGKDFSGTVTPLFATMLIQSQAVEGEGSGQPTEPQHTPTTASPSHVEPIPIVASSSQPKKTKKHRKTKRKATEISQSSGPTTLVADETVHEERGDSVERAATTATSLDAEQGSGNINRTQSTAIPNDPFPQGIGLGVNTLGSGEDTMKLQELMDLYTKLSDRVIDLENVKDAQALEIKKLKKRVKKLEIEGISWFQEDSETQGRYGYDIRVNTANTSITTASINITTVEPITTASAPVTTASVFMKSEKSKAKGVTMQEPNESGTRVRVPPPQIDPKDKGKAKMVEPGKLKKKKDQIEYNVDVAQRLQAELDEEARLEREREEEASKTANIAEWDDVQAMMDADYELAAKLQAEEQG
ncbi:hypothetical protein Tco_0331802 [Tanacetum coccineum]